MHLYNPQDLHIDTSYLPQTILLLDLVCDDVDILYALTDRHDIKLFKYQLDNCFISWMICTHLTPVFNIFIHIIYNMRLLINELVPAAFLQQE